MCCSCMDMKGMMIYMKITIWTIQYFESDTNQALNSRGSSEDGCHIKCQHEHFDMNKVKQNILSH